LITAITALQYEVDRLKYLKETALSVQSNPEITEWILLIDGGNQDQCENIKSLLKEILEIEVKVPYVTERKIGAAAARNLALSLVSNAYVTSIDDDDLFTERAFTKRLKLLEHDSNLHWAGGLLQDMAVDGILGSVWDAPAKEGVYNAGEVLKIWDAPASEFPMNTAGILMRTDSIRSVGGWQGLPSAEDFGMVIGLTGSYRGLIIEDVVYLYRKHLSQSTSRKDFQDLESIVRNAVFQRLQSL